MSLIKEIPKLQEEKQAAEKLKTDTITTQKLAEQYLISKQELAKPTQKYNIENSTLVEKLNKYSVENIDA